LKNYGSGHYLNHEKQFQKKVQNLTFLMLTKAGLLPKNLSSHLKSKTQFYTVSVRTFVIPFYYGSGTMINYGSGSGRIGLRFGQDRITVLAKSKGSYGPVPVPQHWAQDSHREYMLDNFPS